MNSKKESKNQRLKQLIELLKFALSLEDDLEIMRSTIESVVESLEEEVNE